MKILKTLKASHLEKHSHTLFCIVWDQNKVSTMNQFDDKSAVAVRGFTHLCKLFLPSHLLQSPPEMPN